MLFIHKDAKRVARLMDQESQKVNLPMNDFPGAINLYRNSYFVALKFLKSKVKGKNEASDDFTCFILFYVLQ